MKSTKTKSSAAESEQQITTLQDRFEKNMQRHKGLDWTKVRAKLEANPLFIELEDKDPQQVERDKQKLGLFRFDDLLQVLGGVFVVEAAGERWIRQNQRVLLFLACVVLREGVAVADVGIFHAVQEHVHAADPQHGGVEVEPVKHLRVV